MKKEELSYKEKYDKIPRGYRNLVTGDIWSNTNTGKTMIRRWKRDEILDLNLLSRIDVTVNKIFERIRFARGLELTFSNTLQCLYPRGYKRIPYVKLMDFKIQKNDMLAMDLANEFTAFDSCKETFEKMNEKHPFDLQLLAAEYLIAQR